MSGFAIFWIIFAVMLGIVEGITVNFVSIWFAIGAVFAFVTAIFTDLIWVQIAVFVVVSIIALILTRPLVKKLLKNKTIPTNADRFVGKSGVVIEDIDEISGTGQIKVMGQTWSAKPEKGISIDKGEEVIINKIEGVKAVVAKKD